jgi:hypothetical protein
MVELQNKVVRSVHELKEFQVLTQQWKQYQFGERESAGPSNSSKNRTAVSGALT